MFKILKVAHVFILQKLLDEPIAFSDYESASTWFVENVIKEYVEWTENADQELYEAFGADYLNPDYQTLEHMLEKFEYQLLKVDLDPT